MSQQQLLHEAKEHLKKGAAVKGMQLLYALHEKDPKSTEVLEALVGVTLHLGLTDGAIVNLHKLTQLEPDKSVYYDKLAAVYGQLGDWQQACDTYRALVMRTPTSAEAHYNLAYNFRKSGRFEDAVSQYKVALRHNISKPEEVHLNIAVIYSDDLRQDDEAEKHLENALEINPGYAPALYNLANLHEEQGNFRNAVELFEKILAADPDNAKALARLAGLSEHGPGQDDLIARLALVSTSKAVLPSDRVDVLYALGKLHDQRKEYDLAFQYYQVANRINSAESAPYNPEGSKAFFDEVVQRVSRDWISQNALANDYQPVFICGMFRSGSTLLEQMLGAHPDITAGGEREDFVKTFSVNAGYPRMLETLGKSALCKIADDYAAQSGKLFPEAGLLTDKRPDNFLYMGVLKALFPKAKFIYLRRNPMDNCLAIYFIRLAKAMNYSVSLEGIAHYYDQQSRLLDHWLSLFGDDIHVVDYDQLVVDPKPLVSDVLSFLGLGWDEKCLSFHEQKNTVKTASVAQVRAPLYASSSGRWRNYEKHVGVLLERFGDDRGDENT